MGGKIKRAGSGKIMEELTKENRKKLLISQCKREAKYRTKTYGTQHCIALDTIAQEIGFRNWKDLLKQ